MIRRILTFFILLLTLILTSCEHKELKFPETVKFRSLRVVLKWEQLADFEKPEGMRAIFFPLQGKGDSWIFDFPYGEDRKIELPANDYAVASYNYDADGILWKNTDSFWQFTAYTRSVQTPDGEQACITPPWMCGYHLETVSVRDNDKEDELVITLYPENKVSRYTYEVHGIRHLERVADIRASLSGMSGSLLLAKDELPDNVPSERLLFGGEVKDGQIKGGFYTFGYRQKSTEPHVFKLYIKSRTGKLHVLEQDVTQQVRSFPVEGHIGNVHLVLNFDFDIPEDSGGSKDDAGFDVGADDWADVNTDILC